MRFCFRPFLCIFVYVVFFLSNSFTAEAQKRTSQKSTVKKELPSIYDALRGLVPVSDVCQAIKSGEIDRGIYSIMDYLAEHPKKDCQVAEQLLEAFVTREGFDINKREVIMGRTQLPPLAYLIRTNYTYLDGHFSADYISDNALKLLIEAGARVNTYNTDGSSLMNFAIETNNKYLQSYFVEKGINLHHEDKTGTDDVYKLISAGSVAALRKAVDVGSVTLTIENLKNDTKEIAQYPELYDYVAQQCASAAKEYSSLLEFRQRFSDRKSLVQSKWETMAQAECNAAKDMAAIKTIMSRYPDLGKITEARRHSIYRKDVAALDDIHGRLRIVATMMDISYRDGEKEVKKFISDYTKIMPYDPDSKLPLARELEDFYVVCHALSDPFQSGISDVTRPYWYGLDFDKAQQNKARLIVAGDSKYGFADFYGKMSSRLGERWTDLLAYEENQKAVLKNLQLAYDKRLARYREEYERKRAIEEMERKSAEAQRNAQKRHERHMEDMRTGNVSFRTYTPILSNGQFMKERTVMTFSDGEEVEIK